MNGVHHAIVWMDHSEAKVYRFRDEEEAEVDLHSHPALQRLHHRSTGWEAGGTPSEDTEFYQRIMGTFDPTGGIAITGPGTGKLKFKTFLDHFRPAIAARVCGLEELENPAPAALLAIGRRYFSGKVES